ncbi:MAG: ATP-dependent 6-phosphofructokinase [Planctomycetota bacterium]|nr:ATP-dependent 6-phosphofructokinase [Planctomycetota bacterium]MDA1180456.1 ATP-dependent 6-phosphofructokinase [Planctomycetota bacterium]
MFLGRLEFRERKKRRIGILTAGGDAPGLNAVIRGVVKSATLAGYEVIGFCRGYEGLLAPVEYKILDYRNTSGILSQGGTILGTTNKGRFQCTIGEDQRVGVAPELLQQVKKTLSELDVEGLICVGGDGSLTVAQRLFEAGIPVVGVPKTIDNDLSSTVFTFGFDSAVASATDALDRLHTTAASHGRVMILEVMGRHAGWIALHAGIAGGGDVILIPEITWSYEGICRQITARDSMGKNFTLIVVAEGAQLPEGDHVVQEVPPLGGQVRLGGIGHRLAAEIERRLDRECRVVVLGHLQRGGGPTAFDRVLATQFAVHAVQLLSDKKYGQMIAYRPPHIESVRLEDAISKLSRVNPHGPEVRSARALGISLGDDPVSSGCGAPDCESIPGSISMVSVPVFA